MIYISALGADPDFSSDTRDPGNAQHESVFGEGSAHNPPAGRSSGEPHICGRKGVKPYVMSPVLQYGLLGHKDVPELPRRRQGRFGR